MADNNTEKQRVQELTDKLEQGLQDLFNSDSYRNYLATMSKFHNYSFNNTLLIAMQKPDATLVAGYKAWQKNFERHVNKGEKAIRIFAPAPYKIKEERDKIDPVTQELLLDKDGNPQKEEVEITIPAFRAVSVFDVAQTDGKPIPELAAKELLSDVEGYQDMIRAVEAISPVPIELEEIAGDSKGYYDREAKRIAVQENMSESQTLKTMIHEVAHSKLHSKEVEHDEQMKKDRNTKEVEAESVAYTVCQHFGIDTSDYSFGYIAGWSSGRDTKELRSSMDTIRRTASELITGIEEQLQELQRDREVSQEQTKESILLIQNTDLSEFSLLDVYGMDRLELMQALSEMTEDDKLSIQAYLESQGAWTTEIGNQDSREYGEYHLDVRYNTDTDELIDMKERKAVYDKAMEPINADDVGVKFSSTFESEWEVLKITNMSREDVGKILKDMASLDENEWDGNYLSYMEKQGAEIALLASSSKGLNGNIPDFWDYEYDFDAGLTDVEELSAMQQAEHIINRLEHGQPAFSDDERNLIVNYAYKLGNIEKTRELAEHIYAQEVDGNQDVALAMIDAQAEINALPDSMVGVSEMQEYGYTWNEMFPLTQEKALELFDGDLPVYLLHTDGSETTVSDRKQIVEHDGMCGIEKGDWLNKRKIQMMQEEITESDSNREAQLLYGNSDKYGIYQLKDDPELDKFRFEGTESLKRMGITKDNFDAVSLENYKLVYMGELAELQGQTQSETLEAINYIFEHLDDDISVDDVAKYCSYSKYHLTRMFKEDTDEALYQFIKRVRLERSAWCLKVEKERSITDIGETYGYSSSNFATAFKKHLDISPADYRKSSEQMVEKSSFSHGMTLDDLEDAGNKITVEYLEPFTVLYERKKGNYHNLSDEWCDFIERYKYLSTTETLYIECTIDDPSITDEDSCMYELCQTIMSDHPALKEHPEIMLHDFKGGKYAVYHFKGVPQLLFMVYQEIFCRWMSRTGNELDERPIIDIYRRIQEDGYMEIDICFPLKS